MPTEKNEKPIFTLTITEVLASTPEGESDYRISACIHHGGLSLEFDRTVEQVRRFFTERRQKQEQKQVRKGKNKLKTV
jgi:hypothetical protein